MNPFHEQRIRGLRGFRIVVKNPKMFLRPVDQPRANMPTPTTDMAYPLSLGQETLAAAQLLLRLLAFRDILEKDGDFSVPWFSDAESISVIPTVQVCRLVFEAYGFARQGASAVNFKTLLFVLRGALAHSSALRLLNPRLFLTPRLEFQAAVQHPILLS